ncbi:type IV pilus secretin PilQ [Paraburkholderia rhizosphaerae]|uniref:Type IV pilus assembly protein PilQ n=1 Tax=Paraburkholderia rhizosphaerae TaxID=480658 RepID=A0A4R8LB48_9BURK|nr:type IV pilus secretin PilQ [Paraburkholderia rhizosphaerae]TDY40132.1 type IV pilus assembly protein PilQ [Paraburkholderia rhizosphaerae]
MNARYRLKYRLRCATAAASIVTAAAHASLPPLPESMPDDDTLVRYGAPPLPPLLRTASSFDDVRNPFTADAQIDERVPVDVAADQRVAPFNGDDGSRAIAAGSGESTMPREPTRAESQQDTLEGPPVPLAPLARLTDAPVASAADGLPPDRPISLNFRHAELGAVLNAFAQFTGLNIIASDKARGAVTLHLDKVPWRTAFDTLLDVNGLAMERRGNVIWVAPLAELAARERLRFEAHARGADLEPLASRAFELHYAHADEVRKMLTGSGNQRVLSKRGSVMADPRTNLLFITDLHARLAEIAKLIDAIDQPTRQVMIEARIVEGERGFSRNLGVKLSMATTSEDGAARGLTGGNEGAIHDLSARPISGFDAATAGLTLFAARATRLINLELSALEAEGRGQIVSSPRVVTADRMKAIVEQGTELPYQAKVGQGVSGVQFRRASLKLEVEPQITPDGRVVLDLDVAKDSVGEQTAAGPAINTKHVQTRVQVEDGGTVSIGGIYETDDRDDVTRVPVLGKIPLLGALFRHRAHRDARSELVVFITPTVVQMN